MRPLLVKNLLKIFIPVSLATCMGSVALADQVALSVEDCVKCHSEEPAQIASNGASHKTEINCMECHRGHRPSSQNNIPNCSECHSGNAHYDISDSCVGCHNPHQPLNINIQGEQKKVCVSCHTDPEKQMVDNPSQHATFACTFCHADTHGNIPECTSCHEPHAASMRQEDCSTCHQAHMPLTVSYPENTASELCASCHNSELATLSESKSKHSQISCATCHVSKHMTVPECHNCHGFPHPKAMHERFPKCGDCHNIAHDLNK